MLKRLQIILHHLGRRDSSHGKFLVKLNFMIANESSLNFNDLSGVCGPRSERESVDGEERNDNDRALKGWSLKSASNFQIKFLRVASSFVSLP